MPFIYFSYLALLTSLMLAEAVIVDFPYLELDYKETASNASPLSMILMYPLSD